jgi:hypothetical protein
MAYLKRNLARKKDIYKTYEGLTPMDFDFYGRKDYSIDQEENIWPILWKQKKWSNFCTKQNE